ncbi:hypothetical protein HY031_01430, partial [Candidatus Gottesmanbacteria bacterium]|nr:hypothetical protein [Candidatus Gottesmanbacteria bacterium]
IMEKASQLNPALAEKLAQSHKRPNDEKPRDFDPSSAPAEYELMVLPGSTPAGYAASRVLIEQFGRNPQWKIGDERVKKGLHILRNALKRSSTPSEFLAKLANRVTFADADKDAVLSHIFAVEFENEGVIFLAKQVAQSVKAIAPRLWRRYKSLSDKQKREIGITTKSLE